MINLITDRTQTDVDRAKQLAAKGWNNLTDDEKHEWSSGLKGAYNYTDLNRVEQAVAELADDLGLVLATKTDWTERDIPTQTDISRYLANIRAIRAVGAPKASTPSTPTKMSKMTYSLANNIEKILSDIQETSAAMPRCGEIYCGEV